MREKPTNATIITQFINYVWDLVHHNQWCGPNWERTV
jgi:hypothetical protein